MVGERGMKATELMIGDFVMVNRRHYFEWQEVGKVVGLKEGIITIQYNDSENPDFIDIADVLEDDVKPYLLEKRIFFTKIIWESNGFHFGYTSQEEDLASNTKFTLSEEDKGWVYEEENRVVKITFPNYCNEGIIHISTADKNVVDKVISLHQIQHALRLCGIDKEIKL